MTFHKIIPDHEVLIGLEPEELAGYLLDYLREEAKGKRGKFSKSSLGLPHNVEGYPEDRKDQCSRALMEAWMILERDVLIAPVAGEGAGTSDWFQISRRGEQLNASSYKAVRHSQLFPRESLHSAIREKTYSLFVRGEYEVAVQQALKTVEVAVREAGGFDDGVYGVDLMRRAFHVEDGPLTDRSEQKSEREALQALFAGAIGRFKNPSSHRHVSFADPSETIEILLMASHLMRIVDGRRTLTPNS